MERLRHWWMTGISPWVKLVYLVLLANGIPAFCILMSIPAKTEGFFVWTVKPEASARMLGVMYTNALLLVILGFLQPEPVLYLHIERDHGRDHARLSHSDLRLYNDVGAAVVDFRDIQHEPVNEPDLCLRRYPLSLHADQHH